MSGQRPHSHNHVAGSGCCEHEHFELGGGSGGAGSGGGAGSAGEHLLPYIDTVNVRCLNERARGSCRTIFKGLSDRADKTRYMESGESDPEMIIFIPFTANVRLRSLCISGGDNGRTPSQLRLFTNRDDLDFSSANEGGRPQQEILLAHDDPSADTWHPLKPAKFNAISSLQIHFKGNLAGDDESDACIYFVGLKGDFLGQRGTAPATIVYEASPQIADHPEVADEEAKNKLKSLGL